MIILYYEISQGRKTPVYYRRVKNPHFKDAPGPLGLVYRANRIWEWDSETDSVRSIKHRYVKNAEDAEVDPEEFLMIQLAAQEYRDETA